MYNLGPEKSKKISRMSRICVFDLCIFSHEAQTLRMMMAPAAPLSRDSPRLALEAGSGLPCAAVYNVHGPHF